MRRSFLAISAAIALAAPASAQVEFERPYWVDRAVIEILGAAQIDVVADRANFSVTFTEVAADARSATLAASDRARLAEAAIRSRGGDAVSISSTAEIDTNYAEYRNREGERIESERADRVQSYAVSVTLNVVVTDIRSAVAVRAAAMAVGPESSTDLSYALDETGPARLRAYRAAVEDAAARARVAAEASGAPLGRLLVLQEGQGPCLGRWQTGASRQRGATYESPNPTVQMSSEEDVIVVTGSRVNRELRLTAEDIARMRLPEDAPPMHLSAHVCVVYAVGP